MRRLRRDLGRRLNLDLDARELLVELADLERRERLEEACAGRGLHDTAPALSRDARGAWQRSHVPQL